MAISLGKVFEPFIEQRPICVMARGVLENLFNADKIDALFARTAEVQYTRALLFSSVVDLMGQVVLGVQPSVHAAYQAQAAQLGISDQAIYDKLRQVELRVSAELVRDAARRTSPVIGALQAELPLWCRGTRRRSSMEIISPRVNIALRHCAARGRRLCPARFWSCWISSACWLLRSSCVKTDTHRNGHCWGRCCPAWNRTICGSLIATFAR